LPALSTLGQGMGEVIRGAQLQSGCFLQARNLERAVEICLGGVAIARSATQRQRRPDTVKLAGERHVASLRKRSESLGNVRPGPVVPAGAPAGVGGYAGMEGFHSACIDLPCFAQPCLDLVETSLGMTLRQCPAEVDLRPGMPERHRVLFGKLQGLARDALYPIRPTQPYVGDRAAEAHGIDGSIGMVYFSYPEQILLDGPGCLVGKAEMPEVPGLVVGRRGAGIMTELLGEIAVSIPIAVVEVE